MGIREMLQNSELFCELSDKYLSHLLSRGRSISVKQSEMLFLEGDEAPSFYLLTEGCIKVFKSAPDGREIVIKLIRPGDIFAEIILFEKNRYPVSASAIEDSKVFEMSRSTFFELMKEDTFKLEMIKVLISRMRYLTDKVRYLSAYDVEERFFHFIAEQYGKKERYVIDLSKKDIASTIGTIPETLSRLIQRLKKEAIIEWEGNILKVKMDYWENIFEE